MEFIGDCYRLLLLRVYIFIVYDVLKDWRDREGKSVLYGFLYLIGIYWFIFGRKRLGN